MKILIHSLYFHPDQTGICKYSGEMAQWLAARGHRVSVVTGFPHYPDWKRRPSDPRLRFVTERSGAVTIHRVPHYVPSGGRVTAIKRMLVDASFLLGSLIAWVRLFSGAARPDVVISVCPPMFTGIPALLSGWLLGVPWLYHIQDFQVDAALRLNLLKIGVLGRFLYALENKLIRSATRVASITPAMCRRAIDKGARPDATWLLPNWADVRNILPGPADNAFRKELGLPDDSFLAVYAGAMGAKQGLDLVIEAAEQLRQVPRFRLLMIGGGPEWQRLRDVADARKLTNLCFLPVQPLDRLADLLRAADVHLVIQKAEAADLVMPSKLTNILAAGKPSIATAMPGTALADVLDGDGCGIVIPPDDVSGLVGALHRLAADPSLGERMGIAARRHAERFLDVDVILSEFEQRLLDAFPVSTPPQR